MKMHRGFKVRIYPNKNQEKELWKQIYGCRFVWNYLINLQQTRYKNKEKHLSEFEMCRVLPELKEKKDFCSMMSRDGMLRQEADDCQIYHVASIAEHG